MESGRKSSTTAAEGPLAHQRVEEAASLAYTSCPCSMFPSGNGSGTVHASLTCPNGKVAPNGNLSTVPPQFDAQASATVATPPLDDVFFGVLSGHTAGTTGGTSLAPASPLRHQLGDSVEGSLEDVRVALIDSQSVGRHYALTNQTADQNGGGGVQIQPSRLNASKAFVNDLVSRSLQMVNLNPNAHSNSHNHSKHDNIDATPIMSLEEQEPRSMEHSPESSPEPPELEEKMAKEGKLAANSLNPVGPMEFIERYRNRNSSQRPLVDESFLSSKSSFGDTGSSIELKGDMDSGNGTELTGEMLDSPPPDLEDDLPARGQWSGNLDFIFSCISYAVGLGNVWRFPYLCYENGGGAFLVPYLICVLVLGVPLFLMEVALGQYLQAGGVAIWNRIPILKGIGFASMVMIGLCNTYYIVILSWTLYYLFSAFKSPLPWSGCDNPWNTNKCHEKDANHSDTTGFVPPSMEFWNRKVLEISEDLSDVGDIQWHLFASLIVAWILVYLVIYRGIHQSGKIIWFTAMFPYVILVILFGYGISLSGSTEGILFYITPKWEMLSQAKIWVAAGTQLLFTYGIGIGTNIALGSYNTFNHNFFRDSLIACLLSSCTSLFSGFVIFSVLGHLAETLNQTVAEVAVSGPGLAFIVYPEAVTRLPFANFWAILFFIMLLVLGIDSQFCTVESFVTGFVDEWPRFLRPRRQLFTACVVLVHFILGISMITQGGMYIFQLMDNFSASGISLLIVVLLEIVGFCWIYGADNIYNHMCKMLGFKPPRILYYLWVYISPACLLAILVFSIVKYDPPEYAGKPFPWYGQLIGWIIASASIICIPLYVPYYLLFKADQSLTLKERVIAGLWPDLTTDTDSSTGSADLEKADASEFLNSTAHLSSHFHNAHLDLTNGAHHHLASSKAGFHLLTSTGSSSTLATSIADQSFGASAQNIHNSSN